MTYQEIIDLAEQQGWSVRETIEERTNRHLFEFSQESPAGEDFSFTVDGETPESLIHEVYMFAEGFDADEHADMWIHAKESGTAGVPSTRTIVEDSEAIQKMLDALRDALSNDEYEDRWFADTRWHVDDAIGTAAEHGVTLTREQAAQWWEANQRWFHERLVELGNDMLSCVDWDSAICSKCGRVIEPDEIPYTHNDKTDRECTVCDECHDAMWESNQITHCEFCGCWYDTSMLKSDPEPVGGDTFTPCPGCGHDIVDGMTRVARMAEMPEDPKTPQYVVTFRYSFDKDMASYLFVDEDSAKKFLRDNYDCEVKELLEVQHRLVSHSISEDGMYAKIVDCFPDYEDVTEMFISPIYQ